MAAYPTPMSPRFDILIVNRETQTVSSIAAYSLPMEAEGARGGASELADLIREGLRPKFVDVVVCAGEYARGDSLPIRTLLKDREEDDSD